MFRKSAGLLRDRITAVITAVITVVCYNSRYISCYNSCYYNSCYSSCYSNCYNSHYNSCYDSFGVSPGSFQALSGSFQASSHLRVMWQQFRWAKVNRGTWRNLSADKSSSRPSTGRGKGRVQRQTDVHTMVSHARRQEGRRICQLWLSFLSTVVNK